MAPLCCHDGFEVFIQQPCFLNAPIVHVLALYVLLLLLLPPYQCCRRVDDQYGPILMTAVFVVAMVAIFLVNLADLLLLLKYEAKHQGGGDDEGGDLMAAGFSGMLTQIRLL